MANGKRQSTDPKRSVGQPAARCSTIEVVYYFRLRKDVIMREVGGQGEGDCGLMSSERGRQPIMAMLFSEQSVTATPRFYLLPVDTGYLFKSMTRGDNKR